MEDNNTEFSDFFKKKLKEAEATDYSGWDKPDVTVKQAVLQNVSNRFSTNSTSVFSFSKWFIAIASILFLLMGGSVFYLHHQNYKLKNILQKNEPTSQSKMLAKVKPTQAKELNILQKEKEIADQQNQTIAKENLTLKQQLNQIENDFNLLTEEVQTLKTINEQCKSNEASYQKQNERINGLKQQLNDYKNQVSQLKSIKENLSTQVANFSTNETDKPFFLNKKIGSMQKQKGENLHIAYLSKINATLASSNSINLLEMKKTRPIVSEAIKRNHFELGYTYTYTMPDNWVESSLENQDGVSQIYYALGSYSKIGFKGFRIAYSPRNRFWINTGFSFYSTTASNLLEMDIKYDPKGEVDISNNKVRNQFSLITKTNYSETNKPIYFEFNEGELLANDDMRVLVNDVQNLNFYRIPLGIEYYYGPKKLTGILATGLLLAKVSGSQYISTTIFSSNTNIESTNNQKPTPITTKHTMHFYAGLGINYQLIKNIHVRTLFNISNKYGQNNSYNKYIASNLNLGLYWRF